MGRRDIKPQKSKKPKKKASGEKCGLKWIKPQTQNQNQYIKDIKENTLVFGVGPAGTGKTLLVVNYGINEILKKNYKKLIITRPVVEAGEKLGFLPGDLEEKLDPYLKPIFDYINEILGNTEDARGWISKHVEIAPLAFMRGRTFNNSFIILDEAQNTTKEQMKMFLTRIGYDSKAIVTADPTQIDLKDICTSGILEILEVLNNKPDVKICKFYECDIVRSKIVQTIVEAYGDYYDDKEKPKDKL
ncbi:MAG: PhoH family protein [Candidatus Peribacteraceae bacterium]|nr:PhoH family protein [Candidatus Peribacteraceae bacterium]